MKKILLLSFIIFTLIGCVKQKEVIEEKEVRVFWGRKEEIKIFLNSPTAKAERWLIEALGESI